MATLIVELKSVGRPPALLAGGSSEDPQKQHRARAPPTATSFERIMPFDEARCSGTIGGRVLEQQKHDWRWRWPWRWPWRWRWRWRRSRVRGLLGGLELLLVIGGERVRLGLWRGSASGAGEARWRTTRTEASPGRRRRPCHRPRRRLPRRCPRRRLPRLHPCRRRPRRPPRQVEVAAGHDYRRAAADNFRLAPD